MNPASSILSPLEIVRERTRPLHTQLEATIDISGQLVSKASYAQLLERYALVYAPLERDLAQQPEKIRRITSTFYKPKMPLLEMDLAAIGSPPTSPFRQPLTLPALETLDQTLGVLYVVEGSALGGQLLYREVEQRLGLNASNGAAFFSGSGEATSATWKTFTTLFNLQVKDAESAAQSACQTFAAFQSSLAPAKESQP